MPLNAPGEDWEALDRALGDFAASGCVEVREDGQWLAELATLQCEVNRKGRQALVHLWSDERKLRQLDVHRNSLAKDGNHYLYRGAPERWLESVVLRDPAKLDAGA